MTGLQRVVAKTVSFLAGAVWFRSSRLYCVDCDCVDLPVRRVFVDDEMFNEPLCGDCEDARLEPRGDLCVHRTSTDRGVAFCALEQGHDGDHDDPDLQVGWSDEDELDEDDDTEDELVDSCERCGADVDADAPIGGCCVDCFYALSGGR